VSAVQVPPEPPDREASTVAWASRIAALASVFFFGGFLFAFVYLRLQDVNGRWNEHGAEAGLGYAIVILVAMLLAAVLLVATRDGDPPRYRSLGTIAAASLIVAIVARVLQMRAFPFETHASGYAAVANGWSIALLLVTLGLLYWTWSLAARARRLTRPADAPGEDPAGDGAERIQAASARGLATFALVVAGAEAVAFVLLNVVG
jgi:hypothetical protein